MVRGLGHAALLGAVALLLAAPAATRPGTPAALRAQPTQLRGNVRLPSVCTAVSVSATSVRELCGAIGGVFRSNLGTASAAYTGEVTISRKTLRGPEKGRLHLDFGSRGKLELRLRGVFTEHRSPAPNRSKGRWRVVRGTGTLSRTTGSGTYTMVARITAMIVPSMVLLDPRNVDLLHPRYEYRFAGKLG